MTEPATPLDNKEAIAQMGEELRSTISLLITEFVRPTMLQTQANAQAIDRLTAQLDRTESITRIADETSSENEQRFEVLLSEFRDEKQRSDERFQAMQENIQRLFLEVRSTNVAVSGLSDRVESLEAS